LTSEKAPCELIGFDERLRERFESGLIAEIAPPDLKTRLAIVQNKAAAEEILLDAEVAMFIAEKVSSSVRELEGCFNRLAASAALTKTAITVEVAQESLRDIIRNENGGLDVYAIQRHVSDFFRITLADLKSKKRTQRLAFCRQVAMYICRKLTDSSFPAIGADFARNHSTVIYACNLIARRVNNDGAFRGSIEKIERQLRIQRSDRFAQRVQR